MSLNKEIKPKIEKKINKLDYLVKNILSIKFYNDKMMKKNKSKLCFNPFKDVLFTIFNSTFFGR